MTQAQYRADVDGLRAVAVVPVILFHAGASFVGGGFVGVDMFFVISGFVIALSLNKDLEAGRFSISAFYERRARRILPALTVVLLTTYVAAVFLAPPPFFPPFAESLSYAAVFLSNLYFWRNSGYFFNDLPFRPLLHTWSLAIEEQYYIVAPILLFVIFRFLHRRWGGGLAPLILASLALSAYATTAHPLANIISLPTRAWELLLGMLLALRPPPSVRGKAARGALAMLAIGLIAAPILVYSEHTPFPGLAALPPCLGTALLIHLGAGDAPPAVSRLLASRPLVAIGLISYSLYLVHWPLVVFARLWLMRNLAPGEIGMVVAATFAIATALYFVVEQPLRRIPAPRIVVFLVAFAAVAITAVAGQRGHGFNLRHYEAVTGTRYKSEPIGAIQRAWREGPCLLLTNPDIHAWQRDACARTSSAGGAILLWGDSFAAHYAPGLESASIRGSVIQYTAQGCPPILAYHLVAQPRCREFNRHALTIIEREGIERVVLVADWAEYARRDADLIGSTLDALRLLRVETTLIGQSPVFLLNPALIAARRGAGNAAEAFAPLAIDAAGLNAMLRERARAAGAQFIDPMPHLCPREPCPSRVAGENLYFDYGHFSLAGSARAVRAYFPYVEDSRY